MERILENKAPNLSLADATYLRWYEITNALSHAHTDAIFSGLAQNLEREIRKNGKANLSTQVVFLCFRESTQKLAQSHALRRFESSAQCEDAA